MGLGQSLQQVGGMISDNYKSKMKEQLEQQREERAILRNRNTPKGKEYIQKDGVWFEQILGGEQNVLEEKLAPENKVKEFTQADEDRRREIEADALKLRKGLADASLSEKKASTFDEDRAFDMEQARRRTAADELRASRSGRSSLEDTATAPTESDYIDALSDKYKDEAKIVGVDTILLRRYAQTALRRAAIDKTSPDEAMLSILEELKRAGGYGDKDTGTDGAGSEFKRNLGG